MNEKHPFIEHLERLQENKQALAALRKGLGKPIGAATEMYAYVVPYIPDEASIHVESIYYLVATLFALHPSSVSEGNFGDHYAQVLAMNPDARVALERRFTCLLSAHSDDLPFYLRQSISFLKSKEVSINWNQLFQDLLKWNSPYKTVQRRWANKFWKETLEEKNTN